MRLPYPSSTRMEVNSKSLQSTFRKVGDLLVKAATFLLRGPSWARLCGQARLVYWISTTRLWHLSFQSTPRWSAERESGLPAFVRCLYATASSVCSVSRGDREGTRLLRTT